jgi:molybdopterin adenylyltransferase
MSLGRSGLVLSVNISAKKGQPKTPAAEVELIAGEGIRDDAHRRFAHRQVSLLMMESIEEQRVRWAADGKGAAVEIGPGAFAENLTTRGIELRTLAVGDALAVGTGVRLRVTQIGKECHTRCAIYKLTGDCIMPELGIFCEVLAGGTVRPGDPIERL